MWRKTDTHLIGVATNANAFYLDDELTIEQRYAPMKGIRDFKFRDGLFYWGNKNGQLLITKEDDPLYSFSITGYVNKKPKKYFCNQPR